MKPKRCPLAQWELDETSEDKRTIQPDKSKCFFPVVVVRHGCPDNIFTPGMCKCPETHIDGGEYTNCDLFSQWWWYHFGSGKKTKAIRKETPKKKIVPDIKISDGRFPLTNSGVKDRKSTIENWSKFKVRK